MNIVDAIFEKKDRTGIALMHAEVALLYRDLQFAVESTVAELRGSRLWPTSDSAVPPRIGLSCPNGFDHVILSLAVLRAGGVLVPVAAELAPPEKQNVADITALHAIVSTAGQPWQGFTAATEHLEADGRGFAISNGVTTDGSAPAFPEQAFNRLNPALIRFSSGTTGRSKGVVVSHPTLLARVTACNRELGIGQGDRVIWMLPMAHHFAVSIILYLLHGATTVIVDSHLGEDVFHALEQTRGTVLYAAPFHYAMLAGFAGGAAAPSLRLAVSTASALTPEIAAGFAARYGVPLTQGLGIIEVGLPILNRASAASTPLAIGRPQPDHEARLDRPDEDGIGELQLRGPGLFDAYLVPWMPRDEVLQAGQWFATGDLASIDANGDITLRGRRKSVINVAGLKCFPEEIETVLRQHPEVADVCVFPLEHPEMGSVPAARFVPTDPARPPKPVALSRFCKEYLAQYKIPMRYQITDKIERTASGKIKRD